MSDAALQEIKTRLAIHEEKYRKSASTWKRGYRNLLVGSAFLSAAAAVVGKLTVLQEYHASDIAAGLAALSAVLTTLLGVLDFESNFQVNRRSRHEVGVLRLEAEKTSASPDQLLTGLQAVVQRRVSDLARGNAS